MLFFKPKEILLFSQNGKIAAQHLTLRPTKLSISLLVLSAAIWIGAVNYQVNVAYAVCFWVVGFVGVAALLTKRQLLGLQVSCDFHDEVFAGETASVQLTWHDDAKRLRVFWWRGEYAPHFDEKDTHSSDAWQRIDFSGSLNTQNTTWHIPIQKRGAFPQDLYLKVASSAPFGLFHAECRLLWQTNAVAYAAPLSHQNWGASTSSSDPEQKPQHALSQGEDLAYLKPHQQGAGLQNIAWKVYAKRGELMDKAFDAPPPAQHSTTISYRDYPQGTPVDKLASLLTYRVLQAHQFRQPYTLELPHLTLTPQNGLREKCLNALALM